MRGGYMFRTRALVIDSSYRDAGIPSVFLQCMPTSLFSDPPTDLQLVQYMCPMVTPASMAVFNIGNSLLNALPAGLPQNHTMTFSIDFAKYANLTAPLATQHDISNHTVAEAVQDMLNDPVYGMAATYNPVYTSLFPVISPGAAIPQFSEASFSVVWDPSVGYTIANTDNIAFTLDFDVPGSVGVLLGFGNLKEIVPTLTHVSVYTPVDITNAQTEDYVYICSNFLRSVDDGVIAVRGGAIIHNDAMYAVGNGTSGMVSPVMSPISIRGSPLYRAVIDQRTSGISSTVYILYSLRLASGLAINSGEWNMTLNLIYRN